MAGDSDFAKFKATMRDREWKALIMNHNSMFAYTSGSSRRRRR